MILRHIFVTQDITTQKFSVKERGYDKVSHSHYKIKVDEKKRYIPRSKNLELNKS